jgi:hypothetical protein
MKDPIINNHYERARDKAKKCYGRIGNARAPLLENNIAFNGIGFRHLLWKGGKHFFSVF